MVVCLVHLSDFSHESKADRVEGSGCVSERQLCVPVMREHTVYNVVATDDKVGSVSVVVVTPLTLLFGLACELDNVARPKLWGVSLELCHRML